MKLRQKQNMAYSIKNKNENQASDIIQKSGLRFSRQAIWGWRVFDFWFSLYGVAIELDGKSHDDTTEQDGSRDEYNYQRSAIVIIRIRNGDFDSLARTLSQIPSYGLWKDRRQLKRHASLKEFVKRATDIGADTPHKGQSQTSGIGDGRRGPCNQQPAQSRVCSKKI